MQIADFDYDLPPDRIAQTPAPTRDGSRLLVVPAAELLRHATFAELPALLPAGALLIVNDARVISARLFAAKPTGGQIEILLLEPMADRQTWRCMVRGLKGLRPGTPLSLRAPRGRSAPATPLAVRFLGAEDDGTARIELAVAPDDLPSLLDAWGEVPLPAYIRRAEGSTDVDRERYQTLFARVPGAVAAPTAGLHFTKATLAALAARGIEVAPITLRVGAGTFAPVRVDDLAEHVMHEESYDVPERTAALHAEARASGRPVVAVGTTVVRALESAFDPGAGVVRSGPGTTRLFITPGYPFRTLDLLVTNFHLPRSTLLVLVSAFAGRERILGAYAEAVRAGYRFFSYGDAMLLYPRRQ